MLRYILCRFDETTCPDWEQVLIDVNEAVREHGGEAMVLQDMDTAKRTITVRESIVANNIDRIMAEHNAELRAMGAEDLDMNYQGSTYDDGKFHPRA